MELRDEAERFGELFAAVFHRYHRHDPVDGWLPSTETLALMEHLAGTGPLTVREAGQHFGRSQAATSELFARLERRGLIERRADERDRRRTLIYANLRQKLLRMGIRNTARNTICQLRQNDVFKRRKLRQQMVELIDKSHIRTTYRRAAPV